MTGRSFVDALHSAGPTSDRADKMKLYAWLIGDWIMDGIVHRDDGTQHKATGEIHFGWVLQGRAIQDVWAFPGVFYGTTLRIYDLSLDAWHVLWSDPMQPLFCRQIGRAQGNDIVQIGKNDAGEATHWSFTEITPESFHWMGKRSRDDGKTWQLQAEFFARRAS